MDRLPVLAWIYRTASHPNRAYACKIMQRHSCLTPEHDWHGYAGTTMLWTGCELQALLRHQIMLVERIWGEMALSDPNTCLDACVLNVLTKVSYLYVRPHPCRECCGCRTKLGLSTLPQSTIRYPTPAAVSHDHFVVNLVVSHVWASYAYIWLCTASRGLPTSSEACLPASRLQQYY